MSGINLYNVLTPSNTEIYSVDRKQVEEIKDIVGDKFAVYHSVYSSSDIIDICAQREDYILMTESEDSKVDLIGVGEKAQKYVKEIEESLEQ